MLKQISLEFRRFNIAVSSLGYINNSQELNIMEDKNFLTLLKSIASLR